MRRAFRLISKPVTCQMRCLVDNGVASFPPMILQDELLLADWPSVQEELSECDTSIPVAGDEYFRGLAVRGSQTRISAMFYVTIRSESHWVPAIVDTGAHSPLYLSKATLSKFKCEVRDDEIIDSSGQRQGMKVISSIGQWRGAAFVTPPLSAASGAISESNIVGMGILHPEICNEVRKIFSSKFRNVQPTLAAVWVRLSDSGSAFKVTPTGSDIDSLKDAIKVKKPNACANVDADQITIIAPDTKQAVTIMSTPLHANTEEHPYLFELPKP
jgi:hypothetical protein